MAHRFSGFPRRFLFLSLLLGGLLLIPGCGSTQIEPNYPGPEDGLVFDQPPSAWDEALPLGNGMMGALIWGDGFPVRISLDRADLWDLRPVPEFSSEEYDFQTMRRWHLDGRTDDLIRLYEAPYNRPAPTKIPAGRIELALDPGSGNFQRSALSLVDAVATAQFGAGSSAQFLVHARRPLGVVRLRGPAASSLQPTLIAPDFAGEAENLASGGIDAGDLAQLGYPSPERTEGPGWTAFHQQGADGFNFAIYFSWTSTDNEWLGMWSIASSLEADDPLEEARETVMHGQETGWDALLTEHRNWWMEYWTQSSIQLPDPVLERQWFLEQYKFGAASRQNAPPISLQAIWTADNGGLPPWKGDYHHDLNTELSYWPCYSANRLVQGMTFLDWLWETRSAGFDWTHRFFKLPGLNVPMTTDLKGRQIGGWRQYTHSATTAAWLAHHFYLHWKYSQDRVFLEQQAYPYLQDAATFLDAFTGRTNADGVRTFPLSASPEINDNRPEAWFLEPTNYDLALARWLFGAASELAGELNYTEEAARWSAVLEEIPELAVGEEGLLVAPDYPLKESHRHFSHLMAIHPLGLLDWNRGGRDREIIEKSLSHLARIGTDWWTGYSFAWLASLQARAGDGEGARRSLEIFSTAFTLRNSFHCNGDQSGKGFSRFTYRPFTLEGNFAAAAGIQEMLLQSQGGVLRLFPAIPASWENVRFTTLRAEGAFVVSAVRTNGAVSQARILCEKGGPLRIASPNGGPELSFATEAGQTLTLTADDFN